MTASLILRISPEASLNPPFPSDSYTDSHCRKPLRAWACTNSELFASLNTPLRSGFYAHEHVPIFRPRLRVCAAGGNWHCNATSSNAASSADPLLLRVARGEGTNHICNKLLPMPLSRQTFVFHITSADVQLY